MKVPTLSSFSCFGVTRKIFTMIPWMISIVGIHAQHLHPVQDRAAEVLMQEPDGANADGYQQQP